MSVVVVWAEGAAGLPRAHMAMVSVLGAVMLLVLWLETGAGGAPWAGGIVVRLTNS